MQLTASLLTGAALVALSCHANGAPSQGSADLGLFCRNVFLSQPSKARAAAIATLPEGYRISPKDFEAALQLPETRELALAIEQATRRLESEKAAGSDLLALFPSQLPSNNARWSRESPRRFPYAFYEHHLANLERGPQSTRQDVFAQRYAALDQTLAHSPLSDEALAVLTFAARNLTREVPAKSYVSSYGELLVDAFRDHFKKLNRARHLPSFQDFVNATPDMFIEYAITNRKVIIDEDPILRRNTELQDPSTYEAELQNALLSIGDVPLEYKIKVALELLEPELAVKRNKAFEWLMAPPNKYKNNEKWVGLGPTFFQILHARLSDAYGEDTIHSGDFIGAVAPRLSELAGGSHTKEFEFLATALQMAVQAQSRALNVGSQATHRSLVQEINFLLHGIREKVALREREAHQALQAQIQAAAAQASRTVVLRKHKDIERHHIQDPSRTRARRRAESAEAAKNAQPAAPFSPAAPVLREAALSTAKLESLKDGDVFHFERFASSFKAKDSSLDSADPGNLVSFTKRVIEDFKEKHFDLQPWIRAFLMGMTTAQESNGLKRLNSSSGLLWEVKLLNSSYRVMVLQNKKTHTWTWLALIPHDHVPEFIRAFEKAHL